MDAYVLSNAPLSGTRPSHKENQRVLEQFIQDCAAASLLPYVWAIEMLQANNAYLEEIIEVMGVIE